MTQKGVIQTVAALAVLGVLILATPRAAGSFAAALVQVANTTASPATTLDISRSVSQHVSLYCVYSPGILEGCTTSTLYPAVPFVVPVGQSLIITSVDISSPNIGSGNSSFTLIWNSSVPWAGQGWVVPSDGLTHSFSYPSGPVFPAGSTLNNQTVMFSSSGVIVFLNGYLTPM